MTYQQQNGIATFARFTIRAEQQQIITPKFAMKTIPLFDTLQFHERNPYPQPLCLDQHGRVLRFALRPGQSIVEHNTPDSPLYLVVLDGDGIFAGSDGREMECAAGTLIVFDPGEKHSLRARDRDLILLAFMVAQQK